MRTGFNDKQLAMLTARGAVIRAFGYGRTKNYAAYSISDFYLTACNASSRPDDEKANAYADRLATMAAEALKVVLGSPDYDQGPRTTTH